jgi:hypothetical protein
MEPFADLGVSSFLIGLNSFANMVQVEPI